MAAARASTCRRRPARRKASTNSACDSTRPRSGVGARPSTATASRPPGSPPKAAKRPGRRPAGRCAPCWPAVGGPRPAAEAAGQHLDRLGQPRITGHEPVTVAVGADQIGQHPRPPRSDLAPRWCAAPDSGRPPTGSPPPPGSRPRPGPDQQPRSVSIPTTTSAGSPAWSTSSCSRATRPPHQRSARRPAPGRRPPSGTPVGGARPNRSRPTTPPTPPRFDAWTRPGEGPRRPNGAGLKRQLGTSSHQPSASSPGRQGTVLTKGSGCAPSFHLVRTRRLAAATLPSPRPLQAMSSSSSAARSSGSRGRSWGVWRPAGAPA
jgi:hypothetical protein